MVTDFFLIAAALAAVVFSAGEAFLVTLPPSTTLVGDSLRGDARVETPESGEGLVFVDETPFAGVSDFFGAMLPVCDKDCDEGFSKLR